MISVIIPVYNRSDVISFTLDSLIKQTYSDFEVIIIDDCSLDSEMLLSKLEEYKDFLNIKYIRNSVNLHGASSRNIGIKAAKGDYIAFLDSDDIWDPRKLEEYSNVEIAENEILYSKFMDRGSIYPDYSFTTKNSSLEEYIIINKQAIQTSTIYGHTEFIKKVMFTEGLKRFQDYDFVLRAFKYNNAFFTLIPDVLTYMTDTDNGNRISNSINIEPIFNWLRIDPLLLSNKSQSIFIFDRAVSYLIDDGCWLKAFNIFFKFKCYRYLLFVKKKSLINFITLGLLKKIKRFF